MTDIVDPDFNPGNGSIMKYSENAVGMTDMVAVDFNPRNQMI